MLELSDHVIVDYDSAGCGEQSSTGEEDSTDPTYPHVTLIKDLFRKMVDQGFYTPHVRTVYKGDRHFKRDIVAGTYGVHLEVVMHFEVCTIVPTKIDFINALGFIQPLPDEDREVHILPVISRKWCQMVAERIAEPCHHDFCGKNGTPKYALVQKCFKQFPKPSLKTPQHESFPYFMTDVYESVGCCDIDSAASLKGVLASYGYAVTHDIIRYERDKAEQQELDMRFRRQKEKIKKAFIREMKLVLGLYMPQERRPQMEESKD